MGHIHARTAMRVTGLGILLATLATVAAGQNVLPVFDTTTHSPRPAGDRVLYDRPGNENAAFIAQYDDGEVDVALSLGGSAIAEYAMLFDGIGADVSFDSVEACFVSSGGEINFRFEIVIFEDDGPGAAPGTELATFAAQATVAGGAVPDFESHSIDFTTPVTDFYVAVRWNPIVYTTIAVCADHDGGSVQPGLLRADETGAWGTIPALQDPDYTALMIRGFFSTPGIVLESLYLPFFLVDTTDPGGTSTLFAVRNLLDTSTNATIEFYDTGGTLLNTENINLGPRDTLTRNLRDEASLTVDFDGFSRGWLRISATGIADGTPVLSGDYFQVDPDNDFATGEQMPRDSQLCREASIRFLDFGSGTRFGFLVVSPQGTDIAADPPSVQVKVLDEDGILQSSVNIFTSNNAVELNATDLTPVTFGTLLLDFSNSGGGYVFAEYSADNRFSVGMGSQCETF